MDENGKTIDWLALDVGEDDDYGLYPGREYDPIRDKWVPIGSLDDYIPEPELDVEIDDD